MAAVAPRWTCAKCAVSVGRLDGEPSRRPASWMESEDGLLLCLACSRSSAADDAVESAPASCSAEQRSRIRRRALIEFEIGRDPKAPDRAIAQACRTSTAAVAVIRAADG